MKLSEYQLNADLKSGKLARIYVLYGEEDFLIRTYTDRIINLAVPQDAREMNFVKYSLVPGADETSRGDRPPSVEELSDVVLSMPFFSERKCILLKNFDPDMLSKDEFSDYLAMFSDIPETSAVIITRENTEDDPKRFKEKIDKAKMKKLLETADKFGVVCELQKLPAPKLMGMAITKCSRAGCTLSEENAAYLADCVGGSLSLLQTEIEKLCEYRQSGEITISDIDALVPKRIEINIYKLADELIAGRVGNALEILGALFAKRVEPVIIMATLSGHFVDLYRAKLGAEAKKSAVDTANAFNYGRRAFVMKNAYQTVKYRSKEYLGGCLEVLYRANKLMNSSKEDKQLIIERAVVEISAMGR